MLTTMLVPEGGKAFIAMSIQRACIAAAVIVVGYDLFKGGN